MTGPSIPAPRLSFIAHAVINVASDPPELVEVKITRREGREFIKWREDADNLRIRRAQLKLFDK